MAGIDSEKIERFFKEGFSDMDSSYVDEVFCDDNKEKELQSYLSKHFDSLLPEDDLNNINLDHILYKIHYDINTRLSEQRTRLFDHVTKWTLRIAGILILPLLIFIGIQSYKEAGMKKEAWVEINSPAWTRIQFSLPDGTFGWLNSNSSIRYSGNFTKDRKVTLSGEAYFNVYKDKKRPFIVNSNDVTIKVLGTRFNIASYENEKNIEVVLDEGKLLFTENGTDKSYSMNPDDLVIYDKIHKNIITEVVQPQKYISWTEGKLVFRNDPIDVIARRLERWYNVDVEVKGCLSEDLRLRATFIDEGLEDVMSILKRSLPINYKIENHDINSNATYSKKKVIISLRTR